MSILLALNDIFTNVSAKSQLLRPAEKVGKMLFHDVATCWSDITSNITCNIISTYLDIMKEHFFSPSQLVSAAEILLRHLWKCHSMQKELMANVLIGLILVSDYNFTYFSNILEHLNVSLKLFSSLLGFMPKIHQNFEIFH